MKYEVQPEFFEGNYIWSVLETESEQIIARFKFETEARKCAKKHNRGTPWNGWTPSFFLAPFVKVV